MTAPPQSPIPRRAGLPRWVDARLVTGLLLVLASVVIGARTVSHAQARTQLVAFTRDLAAGATIRDDDVTYVRAGLPAARAAVYVDQVSAAAGRQLTRPVTRGELVTRASVRTPAETTTIVVPFPSAAVPELHRGDRIVVWSAAKGCLPRMLIPDATVQDVARSDDGSFGAGVGQRVVLDLPDAAAADVVSVIAQDGLTLRAGVLVGAVRTPGSPAPATQRRAAGG